MLQTVIRFYCALFYSLCFLWFCVPLAAQAQTLIQKLGLEFVDGFKRDPNQKVWFVMDQDHTLYHNIGKFVVKLNDKPGLPGQFRVSGLPLEQEIPIYDFEGTAGLRIKERLGRIENGVFIPGKLDVVTLANGQKFVPGHYYFDEQDGYRQFREPLSGKPEDGYLFNGFKQAIKEQNPFLLEAMPFLATTFSDDFGAQVDFVALTMGGRSSSENVMSYHLLRDEFEWGTKKLKPQSQVNLTHHDWASFSGSKSKYLQQLFQFASRVNINMNESNTPHFLVMFENDFSKHLEDIHLKFRELSNAGIMQNPVIPILVDLLEPEVFNNRGGTDWNRSALETFNQRARVQIYWPGGKGIETSNNLARVFELTLGLKPQSAIKLYQHFENPYLCRNIAAGKTALSCVMGACFSKGAAK